MKIYKKRLLQIAVPIMLSSLISNIQMLIDRIFLGRLDLLYMSAVGNAMAPLWTTMSTVFALGMGASILISQSVGEGNLEKAKNYAASLFLFHNIIPVLLFFFWMFCSPLVFRLMGVADNVMGYCVSYTRTFAPVYLLTGCGCSMQTVLQTSNNTKPLVMYGLLRSLVNIFLDWALIFGKFGLPAMGITGAALGTVIAEYLGAIYISVVMLKKKDELKTLPGFRRIFSSSIRDYWKALRLGMNSAFEDFAWNLGNLVLISLLNTISDVAAGIYSIVFSIEIIAGIVMASLGSGTLTLTGEATGARDQKLYRSVVRTAYIWSACISFLTLVATILFPKEIMGIFTTDRNIIDSSSVFLVFVSVNLFSKALNIVVGNGIRGYGDTRWMFFTQMFGTVCIITIAFLFITVFRWGMVGAFVAVLADEFIRAMINLTRFLRIRLEPAAA